MIPLSYAAIFGGVCTIIGTSTNLIVNGMLDKVEGYEGLGFFEIGLVGAAARDRRPAVHPDHQPVAAAGSHPAIAPAATVP
jgi:hypothetical protein